MQPLPNRLVISALEENGRFLLMRLKVKHAMLIRINIITKELSLLRFN